MTPEEREELSSLISQRLIEALQGEPSAAMIDKAIAWLTRVDSGAVKQPKLLEAEQERIAAQHRGQLPFPTGDRSTNSPLAGLPFTADTPAGRSPEERAPSPRRTKPLGQQEEQD